MERCTICYVKAEEGHKVWCPTVNVAGSRLSTIHNEPCDCPKGQCAAGVDRDENCVNRLPGAEVLSCKECLSMTWHSEGECLLCKVECNG